MDPAPLKIGLTGGIASGKTSVSDSFAALGAAIIDTDIVAREVVAVGEPVLQEIERHFGSEVIKADGSLDRARLRSLVFANPDRRRKLEHLLHPLIRKRTLELIAAESEAPYCIVVVPLLVETGFASLVDRVLVVDCPEALQLDRLVTRDGIDLDQAKAMLGAQTDRLSRLRAADDVIDNGGSHAETRNQVKRLHGIYAGRR